MERGKGRLFLLLSIIGMTASLVAGIGIGISMQKHRQTAVAPLLFCPAAYHTAVAADITVTATVKNHPDNGHGSPSHWADLNFQRSMVLHDNGDGSFAVTTTDTGTLVTRKGAGSPNDNKVISRALPGGYSSTSHGKITGVLDSNYADHDGKSFDDKNGNPFKSAEWAKLFFQDGATGSPFDTDYSFTYKTLDEQWIDASNNDDGQDSSAGDITGKLTSKLTATGVCRSVTSAKWVVKNVQGDRSRTFSYWVWVSPGKWSAAAHGTVGAGSSVALTTLRSTSIAVLSYDGYGVPAKVYAKAGVNAC